MDLISIIVPVYNVDKYVERCINSICEQSYSNIEIILVNDGSTDLSGDVCEKWALLDKRIKYIVQLNQGLSAARNIGIDNADGKYLFFVDSDDWIEKETINRLYSCILENDVEIACCGFRMSFDDDAKNYLFTEGGSALFERTEIMEEYLTGKRICTVAWNKLYLANLFMGVRFPLNCIHEDEFTIYKLIYKTKKVYYLNEILYNYYQRADSIMAQAISLKSLNKLDALDERMCFFEQFNEQYLAEITILEYADYIKYLFHRSKGSKDEKLVKKTLKERYNFIFKKISVIRHIKIEKRIGYIVWKVLFILI